jgi:hypothetical protein
MDRLAPLTLHPSWVRGVPHAWVTFDIDDRWRAALRLALQGNRLVTAEARVFPKEGTHKRWPQTWEAGEAQGLKVEVPPGGLHARVFRRVQIHAHVRETAQMLRALRRSPCGEWLRLTQTQALLDVTSAGAAPGPRRGRPAIPDELLLRVASEYVRAFAAGTNPVPTAAKRLHLPGPRVRDLVHRARLKGFLTPVPQGLGGGELTPLGKSLLRRLKRRRSRRPRR